MYGLVATALFQQCSECAEYINRSNGDTFEINVRKEYPRDFEERRTALLAIPEWESTVDKENASVVVVVGQHTPDAKTFVGKEGLKVISGSTFLSRMEERTSFRVLVVDPAHPDSYENRALFSWKVMLRDRGNSYCWISVRIGDRPVGKITFELFSKLLPRTSTNFWRMCCSGAGGGSVVPEGSQQAIQLSYKGTTFFRILKDAWIMGGDVVPPHDGTGGYSCYGRHFPDESFAVPHDAAGMLGMCNDGEHSNASSFYITVKRMSWMNGKYVAFGRVIDGMKTVAEIHAEKVKHNQAPVSRIIIDDCGVLDISM